MKIISWNVNGIRAVAQKGFLNWLKEESPDILCLQETKAHPEQLEPTLTSPEGYHTFWSAAKKKGYSGVAMFMKDKALNLVEGLGIEEFDCEGRTIVAELHDFILITGYFPNGRHDLQRVPYKLRYSDKLMEHAHEMHRSKGKPIVICGDINTAHREIDLARPKANEGNTGFLPEERAWVDKFIASGFVDIFREYEAGPHHYTWWSYRAGARQKNVGWRIDYFFVTPDLKTRVHKAYIQPDVYGSDHCPIVLELHP